MNPIHMLFSAKEATDAPYVVVVETASVKSLKATDADKGVTAPSVTGMHRLAVFNVTLLIPSHCPS